MLCENINVATINEIAFNVTEAIKKAHYITIFEANVETYQLIWHSKIRGRYKHVNKLTDIPQNRISDIKYILVDFLKSTGKFADDVSDIFDGSDAKHSLFVAWS